MCEITIDTHITSLIINSLTNMVSNKHKGSSMKYQPSINIWNVVPASRIKELQAGQWVYAGDRADKGIFLGVKPSGTIV